MDTASLFAFAAIAVSVLLSPGPIPAELLHGASVGGRAAGLSTALGVCAAFAVCSTVGLVGAELALATSSTLFAVLKLLGSCYLFWQGAMALHAAWVLPAAALVPVATSAVHRDPAANVRHGWLTGWRHPRPVWVGLAALLQLVSPASGSVLAQGTTFVLVLLAAAALCYTVAVIAVEPTMRWWRRPRAQRSVQTASAAMLVALGLQSLGVRTSQLM